jgi:hypothetical protein
MLQGMTPLLHAHSGVHGREHGGLHLPELSWVKPVHGGPVMLETDSHVKTFVVADYLDPTDGESPVPPVLPTIVNPVAESVAGQIWVTLPSTRTVSPKAGCLIPYSCAPPRA